MKIISESFVEPAKVVVSKTGNIQCYAASGLTLWIPKEFFAKKDRVVTYKLHEKNDEFTAYKNSDTVDEDGVPIYLAGDVVRREKESVEFIGFQHDMPLAPADTSTLDEKFALMAKYGISPKL
jgi:hypothetical protein